MGVERPGLRQLQLLVPPDLAVGAGVDELLLSLGLLRIDDDDAVAALLDRALRRRLHAWRIVAVIAHGRNVGDVDHRHLPALLLQNVYPLVAVLRHRRRIAGPFVADIFVHGGERAQIAIGALGDVDDHVPFFHDFFAGTNCASLSVRLISLSFSMAANAADICSMRPSHSSICTSELAPASECVRLGLRALGREQIETAAAVDGFARLAHRIVDRRGFVAMRDAARQPLRRQARADHRAAIVEHLDQVVLA